VAVANWSSANSLSVLLNDGIWASKTYVGPNGGNWSVPPATGVPAACRTASDQVTISGKTVVNPLGQLQTVASHFDGAHRSQWPMEAACCERRHQSALTQKLNLNDNFR
jgi:hypothetical protein